MAQEDAAAAAAGDRAALERLLLASHAKLEAIIRQRMPQSMRGLVGVDDVLQGVFVLICRDIGSFVPRRGPGANGSAAESFDRWASLIARRHLLDMQRIHLALKRDRRRLAGPAPRRAGESSIGVQVTRALAHTDPPSRAVMRREAVDVMHGAMVGMKDEYQQVLRLRFLEGLSVAQTAGKMGRTPRAVHMLCYRALAQLNQAMGPASKFLSSKA